MTRGSCIHWFRKGLRLTDNPALLASIERFEGHHLELRPVFVLDPWFVANAKVGENRWRFLVQSLEDLDKQLKSLGSRLFVVRGQPQEVFQDLFRKWNVKKLTFERDTEPYALKRDESISRLAKEMNVEVVTKMSHTLYDPFQIVATNKGTTPTTYQKFCSLASNAGNPPMPVAKLSKANFPKECALKGDPREGKYNVPDLKELGVDETKLEPCKFPGGETEGLRRLNEKICEENGKWVRSFEKPNTLPNSLEPSTTVLSPYLKFGCISCREFYHKLKAINSKGKHSQPPVSLIGQLLWREFFYTCGATINNFDKMEGNRVCKQIPWKDNESHLKAWKEGRTGYPFIDAVMIQLRKEGWIHHLARHSVACFLTRGDLWVSWEKGQDVFEELLLDADWSINAGNWMWLSASAFFHQYFRVYSPVAFGKKTDKTGEYIRKYVPKLKDMPVQYIYEPWKAPLSVQKGAGCVIGQDYPRPIVDHDVVSKENIQRMKAAYAGQPFSKPDSGSKRSKDHHTQDNKITKYLKKK